MTTETPVRATLAHPGIFCLPAIASAIVTLLALPAAGQSYIGANFGGVTISEVNVIPPDSDGCIGVHDFVEFVNGKYVVFNKVTGARIMDITDANFWVNHGVTPTDGVSDPRIQFDPATGRWFASQVDGVAASLVTNDFLLGVSATSDPTGPWTAFKIKADPNNKYFADFPTLGVSADAVVLSGDMFSTAGGSEGWSNVLSIPKADLVQAAPSVANKTLLAGRPTSTYGYSLQAVNTTAPSNGRTPILAVTDTNGNSTQLELTYLTGAVSGSATLSAAMLVTVPSYSAPPDARQPDGTRNIDTNDTRFSASVIQVGSNIWAANCISVGGNAAIRWYQIDANSGTLLNYGTLSDANADLYYPAIAVNESNTAVIGFTRSGPTAFAGCYAAVMPAGSSSFGNFFMLADGNANYHLSLGATNRWGDYNTVKVDPADPGIFWTTQERAAGATTWATQISEIIVPAAGEVRWNNAAGGAYATASNWFGGAVAGSGSSAVFSRDSNYTVTFGGSASNDRMTVLQGGVTLSLTPSAGYSLTNASSATPSVTVGQYLGTPQLTVIGGTLSSAYGVLAPTAQSTGTVLLTGSGAQWSSSASIYVGGSASGAGGTGVLTVASGAALNVAGTLRAYSSGTIYLLGGTLTAGLVDLAGGCLSGSGSLSSPVSSTNGTIGTPGASDALILSGPLSVGAGAALVKTGPGTLTITGPQSYGEYSVLDANGGTTNLNSDAGGGGGRNLAVNANAAVTFGASQHLLGLYLAPGVTSRLTAGGSKVLILNDLTVAGGATPTATLDLADNDMIVSYTGDGNVLLGTLFSQIRSGANYGAGGFWNGPGITSSVAAANPSSNTALGIVDNDLGGGQTLYTQFDGENIDGNNILVKYTYFGDTNLDGVVDLNDYNRWKTGYLDSTKTGWFYGDFNYDGVVDLNDYNTWKTGYLVSQGGAPVLIGQPIPEPATMAVVLLGGLVVLRRGARARRATA